MGLFNFLAKKPDPIFSKYAQQAELKTRHTPDLSELQTHQGINVFVYNECQSDQPKFELFERPRFYRGAGYTADSNFVMYKKLLGKETFPIALEITDDQRCGLTSYIGDPGQILGEVFTVRWNSVVALDNYLLNGVHFLRKRIKITVPFKENGSDAYDVALSEAYMYVGTQDFWMPQIMSLEGKRLFSPSNRLFNLREFNNEEPLGAYYIYDHKVEAHAP